MSATSFIRRHVCRLAAGQAFTTREVLLYGTRAAVDQALHRLVKAEIIVRLARGVFMKASRSGCPLPSPYEIACIKAAAFGKFIYRHAADIAAEFGLASMESKTPKFFISGRSSSFRFGHTVIKLQEAAMRKVRLGGSKASDMISALWYLGQKACDADMLDKARAVLRGRTNREEMILSQAWMPAWLGQHFHTQQYYDPVKIGQFTQPQFQLPLPIPLLLSLPPKRRSLTCNG